MIEVGTKYYLGKCLVCKEDVVGVNGEWLKDFTNLPISNHCWHAKCSPGLKEAVNTLNNK